MSDLLSRDIIKLEPSVRTYNCLKRAGIDTVGDLVKKSVSDLYHVRNMGRRCVEEVEELLKGLGLGLRKDGVN